MTPRTLFAIILKVLGILFIKDILLAIPQLLNVLSYTLSPGYNGGNFGALSFFVLSIGSYFGLAYLLLFRTDWITDKLKLDEGFEVDAISFTMHRSTVLSICVIIISSFMVINALPEFVRQVILFFQESKAGPLTTSSPKSYLIVSSLQIIIGIFLLNNQRQFVNFIESLRRK